MSWGLFALLAIMGAVLVLPFAVKRVEEELELFLLTMGALAVSASGLWDRHLLIEAIREPLSISLAVLVFGFAFAKLRGRVRRGVASLSRRLGMPGFLFLVVFVLGLASSVITAVIAALVLVEIVTALRLPRANEIRVVILACYAIGLGAALTPLGEPLSTIVVSKLAGEPHRAGFLFLADLLAPWILPGLLVLAGLAAMQGAKLVARAQSLSQDAPESVGGVAWRALKVYAFVAALVLLSSGLAPIVDRYVVVLPRAALYWVNMVSAVLDNATLAAVEIGPGMSREDIRFVLLGLLLSGGMLIPGNIPNIVAAGKLDIKSGEWARGAVPLGLALMASYFILLRLPR